MSVMLTPSTVDPNSTTSSLAIPLDSPTTPTLDNATVTASATLTHHPPLTTLPLQPYPIQHDPLLTPHFAHAISTLSTATRLSLRGVGMLVENVFEAAKYGTTQGIGVTRD